MKKLFLTIAFCMVASLTTQAQNLFSKDDIVVDAGFGLGSRLYNSSFYSNQIPLIFVGMDYGIVDNLFDSKSTLGVGGHVGYSSARYNYNLLNGGRYTDFVVAGTSTLHYQLFRSVDTYVAAHLGIRFNQFSLDGVNSGSVNSNDLFLGFRLGARYFFTPKIGAMAEIGYGSALLNLRVSFRF